MKRRHFLSLAACCLLGLLPGCSFPMTDSMQVEDLLRAPRLSGDYGALQSALNDWLGESAQLKYPMQGELLSPFLLQDLDGDGTPELVIGTMAGDDLSGKMVVALYTLDAENTPQLLFDSTAQSCYYYAGSARFANLGSSDLGGSFVTTVRLEEGEMIDMTYTTDPADYIQLELTPFSQWNA